MPDTALARLNAVQKELTKFRRLLLKRGAGPWPTIAMSLSSAVIEKRGQRSLRDIEDEVGVSFNTLHRVEHGKGCPDLVSFAKICRWLDVDPGPMMAGFLDQGDRA